MQRKQRPRRHIKLHGIADSRAAEAAHLGAGRKQLRSVYGHNLGDAEVQQVQQLAALCPTPAPAEMELTGSSWKLVFTTSTGAYGGKVGPFTEC